MSSWLEKMGGAETSLPAPGAFANVEVLVCCSYPAAHSDQHVRHPQTGRLVCMICHPPAHTLGRAA